MFYIIRLCLFHFGFLLMNIASLNKRHEELHVMAKRFLFQRKAMGISVTRLPASSTHTMHAYSDGYHNFDTKPQIAAVGKLCQRSFKR